MPVTLATQNLSNFYSELEPIHTLKQRRASTACMLPLKATQLLVFASLETKALALTLKTMQEVPHFTGHAMEQVILQSTICRVGTVR